MLRQTASTERGNKLIWPVESKNQKGLAYLSSAKMESFSMRRPSEQTCNQSGSI
jgi:hypothetical protein